jgi:hypothetical protein
VFRINLLPAHTFYPTVWQGRSQSKHSPIRKPRSFFRLFITLSATALYENSYHNSCNLVLPAFTNLIFCIKVLFVHIWASFTFGTQPGLEPFSLLKRYQYSNCLKLRGLCDTDNESTLSFTFYGFFFSVFTESLKYGIQVVRFLAYDSTALCLSDSYFIVLLFHKRISFVIFRALSAYFPTLSFRVCFIFLSTSYIFNTRTHFLVLCWLNPRHIYYSSIIYFPFKCKVICFILFHYKFILGITCLSSILLHMLRWCTFLIYFVS